MEICKRPKNPVTNSLFTDNDPCKGPFLDLRIPQHGKIIFGKC